jgi:hypothetical protein
MRGSSGMSFRVRGEARKKRNAVDRAFGNLIDNASA